MSDPVVVTGIGVKTPAGTDVKELTDAMATARSTAAVIPELAELDLPVAFGCQVPAFDTAEYVPVRESRQYDRTTLLAVAAAADAVADAGLESLPDPDRTGVYLGVGAGGIAQAETVITEYHGRPDKVPAFSVPRIMPSAAAARIGIRLGVRGPALTFTVACASGTTAIGEAMRRVRSGELDLVVAGGAESSLSPFLMSGFARMGALSPGAHGPGAASRPFDAGRDGFVMGEGAALLVLERLSSARARGARVLGTVLGYGANSDAHHIVAPSEDGAGAAACMRAALVDAGLSPSDVGHINAHGTSTPLNDLSEARAILDCFDADGPPVTASKGVLGHSLGAAGATEAVVTLLSAVSGEVPPVANFVAGEQETARIDVVSGAVRHIAPAPALTNSFAFGGHNAALVVAPW